MASQPLPEPLSGVGITAIGVALIRARESERDDRLYDDPYARAFGDAAREAFHDPAAPPGSADTWARVERLVDVFYEGRTVGVRLADDSVAAAVDAGCEQLVMLGAGLDTRAFRLGLPAGVAVFEIDLPGMFAFKEPVLRCVGAEPTCRRHVVPADLRGEWESALRAAGLRAGARTAWMEEGVFGYLPQDDARAAVATIAELSGPGSRLMASRCAVDPDQPRYRELARLVERPVVTRGTGLGPDGEEWLRRGGWRTELTDWDDLVASLGRGRRVDQPAGTGSLLAIRE